MNPVRSKKSKISADSLLANRTSNGMKKSVILMLVDRLMGAGESIHTVTLSWGTVAVSSKKIWCVSRRHQRYAVCQAVSSVAPSVCQCAKSGPVSKVGLLETCVLPRGRRLQREATGLRANARRSGCQPATALGMR